MRRKKIYLAAIIAAVMALQAPVTVFAEDEPITEEGPVTETFGDVTITDEGWKPAEDAEPRYQVASWGEDNSITTKNVTSTVSSDKEDADGNSNVPAVSAGEGGTANVNGSVSSANTGAVYAENGTVNVTGDVTSGNKAGATVTATDGSTVEIGGNVTNKGNGTDENSNPASFGIELIEGSTVKVGGDVTANSAAGIVSGEGNNTVKVEGSVSSNGSPAIVTNDSSNITVGKDVSGKTGIIIEIKNSNGGGMVEVLGTVKSTTKDDSVIVIETDKTDKDELIAALPTIIVGSLEGAAESPEDYLWISSENDMDEAVVGEVYEAVYNQFLYYIAKDKISNATLSVSGADSYANGWTSKEGKSLTVTAVAADGYEVSSFSGADVVKNADGTYTVIVQRGKGIDFNAVITAIVKAQETACGSSSRSSTNDSTPTVVIPVYAVAQKQFQTAIAAQIKTLPANGKLKIDMKDCISFNRKTFELLSQRKDIDIEIIYTWQGKKYRVVIPAGYDILSLLDANGYCGCLYLNSIFGSTEVTK